MKKRLVQLEKELGEAPEDVREQFDEFVKVIIRNFFLSRQTVVHYALVVLCTNIALFFYFVVCLHLRRVY